MCPGWQAPSYRQALRWVSYLSPPSRRPPCNQQQQMRDINGHGKIGLLSAFTITSLLPSIAL
jgi:hypothetical protein